MKNQTFTYRKAVEFYKHPPLDISGFNSDDIGWSDQMILDYILDVRAGELKRRAEKGKVDKHNVQTLPCIELEEVDLVDCPCAPPTGCMWLRSTSELPRLIKTISVTSIDGNINFNSVDWTKFKYKTTSRIKSTQDKKYYTTKDTGKGTYLYILNDSFLKAVSLSGVFEDPYQAVSYPKCGEVDKEVFCNPWDTDIKTDRGLFDIIMRTVWQILPAIRYGSKTADTVNDASDNTNGVIQPKF